MANRFYFLVSYVALSQRVMGIGLVLGVSAHRRRTQRHANGGAK